MSSYIRQGQGAVRPYVYGEIGLPSFLCEVFGAEEVERHDMSEASAHVELRIGDAIVVVEAGRLPPGVDPTTASVYVYVPDVDAAYERAIRAGASSLSAPEDKPYDERSAAIRDGFGNIWYVSSYTG